MYKSVWICVEDYVEYDEFYSLNMLIAFIIQAIIEYDSEEYSVAQTAEHGGTAMPRLWVQILGNA